MSIEILQPEFEGPCRERFPDTGSQGYREESQ